MDYLAFLDEKNEKNKQQNNNDDNQSSEQKPTLQIQNQSPIPEPQTSPIINPVPEEEPVCLHNQVLGNPANGGICVDCNDHLTKNQMGNNYRQFGLMEENEKIYTRAEYGIELLA